jgi:hypothetical protein
MEPTPVVRTTATWCPAARRSDDHRASHLPRSSAQSFIDSRSQCGQQAERRIGIGSHGLVEGPLIELTHLGRHPLECLVPGEFTS